MKLEFPTAPAVAESATVVLVWFTPEEKAKLHRGVYVPPPMLEQFLDRARVVQNVALGDGQELALDYPGGDAAVVPIVDRTKASWPTMSGGGSGNLLGVADAVNGRAGVKLEQIPEFGPQKEGCVGNRLELLRVKDPARRRRGRHRPRPADSTHALLRRPRDRDTRAACGPRSAL